MGLTGLENLVDFVNDDSATNCGGLLPEDDLVPDQRLPEVSKNQETLPSQAKTVPMELTVVGPAEDDSSKDPFLKESSKDPILSTTQFNKEALGSLAKVQQIQAAEQSSENVNKENEVTGKMRVLKQ